MANRIGLRLSLAKRAAVAIAVLAVLAAPVASGLLTAPVEAQSLERTPAQSAQSLGTKEAALKDALLQLRQAFDRFRADQKKYPSRLSVLVTGGYLKKIPTDPFTRRSDSWQTIPSKAGTDIPTGGVFDVRSGSRATASDGTKYADRTLHRASEPRNGARPIATRKEHPVWAVVNAVIRERFEHLDPFPAMIMPPVRWWLRRPANDHIRLVALVEGVPVLRVPGIVQRLHQLHVLLLGGHVSLLLVLRSGGMADEWQMSRLRNLAPSAATSNRITAANHTIDEGGRARATRIASSSRPSAINWPYCPASVATGHPAAFRLGFPALDAWQPDTDWHDGSREGDARPKGARGAFL